MPSSAPLVSGYDSDSDHSENDAGPSSSSIAAPRSSGPATSSSGTFGLKLPPPSNTNTNMARPAAKRKADQRLQIKIDALDEEEGKEATPQVKRPTMDKASSSSSHGLFGLLPAPSQKPTKPDVKTNAATAAAAAADIAEGVGAQEDEQPNKRAKGNNDFMKAGTATKLVLNMISTGVMIRLGKTYGNVVSSICRPVDPEAWVTHR